MDNEKEHDFTKLMLEAIRAKSSNHIRSINENESGDMGAGFESPTSQTPISGDQAKPNIDVEETFSIIITNWSRSISSCSRICM